MSIATFNPELDLMLERVVDVPREKIWQAWTTPEKLMPWFCPLPWKTVKCEIDLRLGGRFYTVMQSPEGQTFPNQGCYLEIIPNEKLVWTNALEPGFRPSKPPEASPGHECAEFLMTATILLEPLANGTKYTAYVQHNNVAHRLQHENMGFEAGWGACLDQLVAMIKNQS
ncbi:MAG TPA: SRPBCC family protein [Methylotenera sp.]|nr:SRPBCC family protein [Methylotenera sp.]HPH04407.1 SRPBCC family protein [Methylotenera sp.]HPM99961.1 SRPBCC family protein [Methylotenera sp.]